MLAIYFENEKEFTRQLQEAKEKEIAVNIQGEINNFPCWIITEQQFTAGNITKVDIIEEEYFKALNGYCTQDENKTALEHLNIKRYEDLQYNTVKYYYAEQLENSPGGKMISHGKAYIKGCRYFDDKNNNFAYYSVTAGNLEHLQAEHICSITQ